MQASDLLARARSALLEAIAVVPHQDADGLAAGAIALRARGEGADRAVILARGETPFGDALQLPPGPVALLDWGVRPLNRPGLIVDHHAPETRPRADQLLVSGYGEPLVSTSVLMKRIVPEALDWLAAIGAVGDYGDAAFKLPEVKAAPRTAVRKLVPLVNAPRRAPNGPVRLALALLVQQEHPNAILSDPRIEVLEQVRREFNEALRAAMKKAPMVTNRFVLLRFASPYQVHPIVAATWVRRMAPRIVIAANDDYLPGKVNFAVRGGTSHDNLRLILRAALPEAQGEYAMGHDRATGGSLSPDEFETLLANLGFGVPARR